MTLVGDLLLGECRMRGVQLFEDGGRLRFRGPHGTLAADGLLPLLRQHREAVLASLRRPPQELPADDSPPEVRTIATRRCWRCGGTSWWQTAATRWYVCARCEPWGSAVPCFGVPVTAEAPC